MALLLFASFVFVTDVHAFAKDKGMAKTYEKGTLVDISKPNARENSRMQVTVRFGDMNYTGETRSGATREFVVGEPVQMRVDPKYFYLKRPNGKEIKLKIFKRERVK
jgi:hypothetical protein